MDGKDQTLYNKLLFRKASYEETKTEMETRNILFSPSDTHYILTLRLRKSILENANIQTDIIQTLEKELLEYERSKRKAGAKYNCCLVGCKFSCFIHGKYVSHLELVHHNSKARFTCQHRHSCTREFQTVQMLKSHIKGAHDKRTSSVQIAQNQLVEQLTKLKCCVQGCSHAIFSSIAKLKQHLQTHTDRKEEVQCIFCSFSSNTSGTLRSHMSRKHQIQTVALLDPKVVVARTDEIIENESDGGLVEELASTSSNLPTEIEEEAEEYYDDDTEDDSEEVFLRAVAIMVTSLLIMIKLVTNYLWVIHSFSSRTWTQQM